MRLCVWSGPRNLSTAMMTAFARRPGWRAMDEPFYAAFLARSGLAHPMREAVLAAQPADPAEVARACGAPGPLYQKHMVHHMDGMPWDWARGARHVVLIRHPARVIASYARKRARPTPADLGFEALAATFDRLSDLAGAAPLVVDTSRVRADPGGQLRALCAALDLRFDAAMLSWPPGPKPHEGAWAPH